MDTTLIFSKNLALARQASQMTTAELEGESGIKAVRIQALEIASGDATINEITKLCDALSMPVNMMISKAAFANIVFDEEGGFEWPAKNGYYGDD